MFFAESLPGRSPEQLAQQLKLLQGAARAEPELAQRHSEGQGDFGRVNLPEVFRDLTIIYKIYIDL